MTGRKSPKMSLDRRRDIDDHSPLNEIKNQESLFLLIFGLFLCTCLTHHLIFSIKTCISFSAGRFWGVWGWKGLWEKSFGGVCCWGINKIEGFLKKGFSSPLFGKRVFCSHLVMKSPPQKVESDVDLSDLLDFHWELWLRSEERKAVVF